MNNPERRGSTRVLWACLVVLGLGTAGEAQVRNTPIAATFRPGSAAEPAALPSAEVLEEAIVAAAGYLVRACQGDGSFTYRVNLNPEVTPRPRYNLLRHAGAMYALSQYHEWHPDRCLYAALGRTSSARNHSWQAAGR